MDTKSQFFSSIHSFVRFFRLFLLLGREEKTDLAIVHRVLGVERERTEKHGDHEVEDAGCGHGVGIRVIVEPLEDDEEAHVSKDRPQEENLRDELEKDVDLVLKVDVIRQADDDSHRHLNDSENDRHLHLQRVVIIEFVGCQFPRLFVFPTIER